MGWWFSLSVSCVPLNAGKDSQMAVPSRDWAGGGHFAVPRGCLRSGRGSGKGSCWGIQSGNGRSRLCCHQAPAAEDWDYCLLHDRVLCCTMCCQGVLSPVSSPSRNSKRNQLTGLWFLDGGTTRKVFRSLFLWCVRKHYHVNMKGFFWPNKKLSVKNRRYWIISRPLLAADSTDVHI